MMCPKDNNHDVVENEVMGKKFFYCRGCKDEVAAQPEKPKDDYPWWTGMQYTISQYGQIVRQQQDAWALKQFAHGFNSNCGQPDCDLCDYDDSDDEGVL